MECDGVPLAYDAQEATFYCTLGLEHGEEWPQMHLTAPGARGVSLIFADDYTYDSCADAMRDGYAYQIMAYTDTQYAYIQIVFTGLPLVTIECDEPIALEDTAARVTVSAYGCEPVVSAANVHIRGGGSVKREKSSLKVNFTRTENGRKNTVALPELGARSDLILNGMSYDEMMLREQLGWALYDAMLGEAYDGGFDARRTAYAELFVNGEYRGLYLMMEPVDPVEELRRESDSAPLTDSVYRSLSVWFVDERPWQMNACNAGSVFEWRYSPSGTADFSALQAYNDLLAEPDDEVFVRKAEVLLDMESLIRYAILCQAGGFVDNVHNNMYVWAHQTPEGMRYRFAPWDMDTTFGKQEEKIGMHYENWVTFPLMDRVLLLDVANARERYAGMWRAWREDVLTAENVTQLLEAFSRQMTDSGALLRNAMRWDLPVDDTAGYEISAFAQMRLEAVDQAVELITGRETPSFLAIDWYDETQEHPPIVEGGLE